MLFALGLIIGGVIGLVAGHMGWPFWTWKP
jgi:hypothetical protein